MIPMITDTTNPMTKTFLKMMEILSFPMEEPEIVDSKSSTINHKVLTQNLWTISVMKTWMKIMNMMAGKTCFVNPETVLDRLKRGMMHKDARKRREMIREISF